MTLREAHTSSPNHFKGFPLMLLFSTSLSTYADVQNYKLPK